MFHRFERYEACQIAFMKKRSTAFLIAVISSFLILTGCTRDTTGEIEDRPSSAKAVESISNAVGAALSASDKLPDSFPKDIPIPRDAQMLASMKHEDSVTVSFEVNKSFDETLKIYKEYFKSAGYQMTSETLIEDSFIGAGTLDGNTLTVLISLTTDDSNLSSVSLTYLSKK
jgi:uncharacterized lipoprotein YajG